MPYLDPEARRKAQKRWYQENRAVKPHRAEPTTIEEKRIAFSTRLPSQLVARMSKIKDEAIATNRYPWRTMSAVHEALLLKGFEGFTGDPFFDEMHQFLQVMSQINHVAQERKEAQAAMGRFKTEIAELLKIRARDHAVQYFHGVLHDFQAMSESIWRDWAIAEMRKAYPQLAKETPRGIAMRERRALAKPVNAERRLPKGPGRRG